MNHDEFLCRNVLIYHLFVTGFQTIIYPEGVQQLIEEYIAATDIIIESPYKAPFEEQINIWEKKIRVAKENLELWLVNQADWVDLQDSFKSPDAEEKLPAEYKLFVKMERIWRRVMRLVRDNPAVSIRNTINLKTCIFLLFG